MDKFDLSQSAIIVAGWISEALQMLSPFGADSRLHWTGLTAFFVLGLAVYAFERVRTKAAEGGPLRFLFPPALTAQRLLGSM